MIFSPKTPADQDGRTRYAELQRMILQRADGDARSAALGHISKFTTNSFAVKPEATHKRT